MRDWRFGDYDVEEKAAIEEDPEVEALYKLAEDDLTTLVNKLKLKLEPSEDNLVMAIEVIILDSLHEVIGRTFGGKN